MKRAYLYFAGLLAVIFFAVVAMPASATSGWLKSASIKTCPDGVTYGQHGNGHWHVALKQQKGNRYQASGGEIANDPCPGYTVNQGTAAPTGQQSQPATPQPAQPTPPAPQPAAPQPAQQQTVQQQPVQQSAPASSAPAKARTRTSNSAPARSSSESKVAKNNIGAGQAGSVNNGNGSTDNNAQQNVNAEEKKEDGKEQDNAEGDKQDDKEKPKTKLITQDYPQVEVRLYDANRGNSPVKFKDGKYKSSQTSGEEYFTYKVQATSGAEATLEQDGKKVKSPVKLKYGDNTFWLIVKDKHDHTNRYQVVIARSSVANEVIVVVLFAAVWVSLAWYFKMFKWSKMHIAMKIYTVACIVFILCAICGAVAGGRKDFAGIELKSGRPSIVISYYSDVREVREDGVPVDDSTDKKEDAAKGDQNSTNGQAGQSGQGGSTGEQGGQSQGDQSSGGQDSGNYSSASASGNTPVTAPADPMTGITIAEDSGADYSRRDYQPNWRAGGGCDIRSRLLSSASTVGVQYGRNGCTVTYGSWVDPYTGVTETGNPYRGDGTANDMDIDHIIPLHYVNNHGGSNWPASKKRQYGASLEAMSQGVYVAVSASANRQKSDKGPSQYYPPNGAYRCEYSRKWRDIARTYGISLSSADYNIIKSTLISCGISFDLHLVPTLSWLV